MGKPKAKRLADQIPVLDIRETHFVALDGAVGTVLECTGLNTSIMSAEEAEATAESFAGVWNYLEPNYRVQLVVENRPLRGEEWVPRHVEQYAKAPVGLLPVVDTLQERYTSLLKGRHVPDLRYYVVILTRPQKALSASFKAFKPRRRTRTLIRQKAEYEALIGELEIAVSDVVTALSAMGISSAQLGRNSITRLLWEIVNPEWSQAAPIEEIDTELQGHIPPATIQTVRERLAKSRMVEKAEYVRLDGGYERTLGLKSLPASTFAGWLHRLASLNVSFRFALHIQPLDRGREQTKYERKLTRFHGVLAEREHSDRAPDISQLQTREELAGLLQDMATSDTTTFRLAAFATIRAHTAEELKRATNDAVRALSRAGGTSIDRCLMDQLPAWKATLPLCWKPTEYGFTATTEKLAHSIPFLHHRAGTPNGYLIGFSDPGRQVALLDPFYPEFPNSNMVALGKPGSGKTMFAQSMSLKVILSGGKVVVIDRSVHHWDALVSLVGGSLHNLTLDGGLCINPWDLPKGATVPPHSQIEELIALHTLMIGRTAAGGDPYLSPEEEGLLSTAIRHVYERVPQPQESDLYRYLLEQGTPDHISIAHRLESYVGDGVYAPLIDGPTTLSPDTPLEVFNFREFPQKMLAFEMSLLLKHVWKVLEGSGVRPMVVKDESWALMNNPVSAEFVRTTTRTGRHLAVSNLDMSQELDDYLGELGKVVLNTSTVRMLFQQGQVSLPTLQNVFQLTDDAMDSVVNLGTDKRAEGAGAGAYMHIPEGADSGSLRVYVTPEEYWLFTSGRDERQLRERTIEAYDGDVLAAVRELARTNGHPEVIQDEKLVAI